MATPTVLDSVPVTLTTSAVGVTSWSFTYTVPGGGSNKLLVFMMAIAAGVSSVSGTWNGSETLTIGTIYGGAVKNMLYGYVANPTAGSHTFALSWTGSGAASIYVVTLQDAAQASPIDANNAGGVNATSITTSVTTSVGNDLLLDMMGSNSAVITPSPGGGQTTLASLSHLDGSTAMGSYKAAASSGGSESMSYTFGSAFVDHQVIAVKYAAAPAGPANLKSYNTNLKANIKSINTNLIANVKTLNTNA